MSEQEPIGTRDWDKEHWRQAALQTEQVSEGFKYRNRSLQARIRELEAEVERLKAALGHWSDSLERLKVKAALADEAIAVLENLAVTTGGAEAGIKIFGLLVRYDALTNEKALESS